MLVDVKRADESLIFFLYYFNYLCFGFCALTAGSDINPHTIAIESMHGVSLRYHYLLPISIGCH